MHFFSCEMFLLFHIEFLFLVSFERRMKPFMLCAHSSVEFYVGISQTPTDKSSFNCIFLHFHAGSNEWCI